MTTILRSISKRLVVQAVGMNVSASRVPYDDSVAPAFGATTVQDALDAVKPLLSGGVALEIAASATVDFDNDGDSTLYTVPASKLFVPVLALWTKVSGGDAGATDQWSLGKNASRSDIMGGAVQTLNGLATGSSRLFAMRTGGFSSGSHPSVTGMEIPTLAAGDTVKHAKWGGSGNGFVGKIRLVGVLLDA